MSYRNSRDKKPERLYAGILRLLVMSWLLPLVLIGAVVFYVLSHQIERQSAEEMQRAMDTAAEICEGKLKDTIRASRNASYVPTIKESWEAYQKKGDSQELYENVYRFISTFYNYDENLCSSMVYFCEKPERLYISYSGKIGADYESIRFVKQNAWENVRALAETIDTRIGFYHCMGHLYLVRNIVNHDFVPVAVIVLELDCEEIFQGLEGIAWHEDAFVWIDGENVTGRTVPGTELNITTTFAGEESNVLNYQNAVQAWMDKTGCVVNDSSATADEAFKARVVSDFETGAEPDVLFYFNGNDSNPFVEAGKVVSIDEIRKVYPDYASNMKDSMLEATASPADGVCYSVPFYGYWEGLFVNKEVCEAAGVDIPGPDTTWDEFLETCQTIKDAGYTPIAVSLAKEPHYWFEFAIYNHTSPTTHTAVPKAVDDEVGKAWAAGLTDIKTLFEKGYLSENTNTAEASEVFQNFIDGKSAFYLDGSWKCGGIAEATDNIDNFTVTYVPGAGERKATDIIGGLSSGWYISKKAWDDPDKRAAAVSFITDMTTDESVSLFAGVAATALKNGATVDESTLNKVQIDSLEMTGNATAVAGAAQDLATQDQRAPIFDHMPEIVTGSIAVEDAIQQVIDNMAE